MSSQFIIIILIFIIIALIFQIVSINNSLNNIINDLKRKKSGTNSLITTNVSNKKINKLISKLNNELESIHEKELQYENGNQDLYKLITNISHDLRTPLTAILGYIDLLNKEKNCKKQKNYLNIINNKTQDLINLTEQLFDYLKILDTKDMIILENICINDILEEVILSFYSLFKKKNIEPKIIICKEKVFRNIDKFMLKRIFENIISNAIKYSDGDIKIELKENGDIYFSNQTSYLDKISVGKIFDRYFTINDVKKKSGIGLSIVKQFVELLGGNIQAEYQNDNLIIKIQF